MSTFSNIPRSTSLNLCVLTACLALWAQPAAAELASLPFPVGSATPIDSGIISTTIIMDDTGDPGFAINFVLPRDYADNEPVKIIMYLSHASGGCTVHFRAAEMDRIRPGTASLLNLPGPPGGSPAVGLPAGNDVALAKTFNLRPGGALADLKRGDAFMIIFTRLGDNAADNCAGFLRVRAIDIRYPLRP